MFVLSAHLRRTAGPLTGLAVTALLAGGCHGLGRCRSPREAAPTPISQDVGPSRPAKVAVLDNGMTLATVRAPEENLVAIQMWSDRGVANAPADQLGVSSWCAAARCGGPPPPGLTVRHWNSYDNTVCEIEGPASLAAEVEAHALRLLSPSLPAPAPDGTLCQDLNHRWRHSRGEPHRLVAERLFQAAYGNDPYGRPALTASPCSAAAASEFPATCQQWFTPQRLTLSIVGPEEPSPHFIQRLERIAGTTGPSPPEQPRPVAPTQRLTVAVGPVSRATIAMGFVVPHATTGQLAALELWVAALAKGPASRLRRSWRTAEAQLTHLRSYVHAGRRGDLMVLAGQCPPSRLEAGLLALWHVAQSASTTLLDERELARARQLVRRAWNRRRLAARGVAGTNGFDATFGGGPRAGTQRIQALSRFSAMNLREIALQFLVPHQATVAILLPEGHEDTEGHPLIDEDDEGHPLDVRAVRATLEGVLVRSQAGINTGSRPRTQTSTVTRRALEKGPTVLVQEVAGAEVISLRVSAPLTPRGTAGFRTGPVSLLHDLLGDETPCQPKTGYHGAGEDDYMPPPTALTVCLDVEPEALQAGLDQILGSLLAPNWPTLTASHAGVARHHSTLAQLGQQALNELLYPVVHGRSATPLVVQDRNQHPRRDYLDHWHAQLVRAEELVITVVGATTEQNVLTALGQTWTSRPWTNAAQGPIPAAPENRAVPTTEPHRVVADTDRALIWLAFPTQGFHESDWLALEVLRQWLNAPQGPLARALATNGLARLAPPSLWHGPGIGHLILAMETMPANETETIQTARQTLAGFALDGPAEEGPLFRAAQRRAALALARGLSTPSQRAAALDEAERGGIRPEQRLAASMEVLNVSAATVQAVAQRLLTPDRARLVVVGPPPTQPTQQPTQDTQEQPTQPTQDTQE